MVRDLVCVCVCVSTHACVCVVGLIPNMEKKIKKRN